MMRFNDFIRSMFPEPKHWPDETPEQILRDDRWTDEEINSLRGQRVIIMIGMDKVKHALWAEFFGDKEQDNG